jgi:outer membrane protein insertion porin family
MRTLKRLSPEKQSQDSLPSLMARLAAVACVLTLGIANSGLSQGPGAGAAGGANQAPVFSEAKYRERVWEEGGPLFQNIQDGILVLGIVIEGNRTISENAILTRMNTREDRVFDSQQLQRDINKLYGSDWFSRIDTFFNKTADGIYIRLSVTEKPLIRTVIYHGNVAFSDRTLAKQSGVKIGDPASPSSIEFARSRLADFYRSKGFNDISIVVTSGNRPADREVVFRISEGELQRINDIKILGSNDFDARILKTKIKSGDGFGGMTPYAFNVANMDTINEDNQRLENYYRALGYFNARVDYFYDYDETGKWVTLTFAINEGERFTIRDVIIKGNKYFDAVDLMLGLELTAGQPFNQAKMSLDTNFLQRVYGARGFAFVDISPVPIYLEDNQIDLLYEIEEGSVYRISDVRVHLSGDDSFTKHRVPINIMGAGIRPGRLIDAREIDAAIRRLGNSQIFNTNPADGEMPDIKYSPFEEDSEFESDASEIWGR